MWKVVLLAALTALACGACAGSAETDPRAGGLTGISEEGLFRVTVASRVEPVPINRIHEWTVRVETPDGQPVEDASIVVDGGMPEHQHGLPTRPQVTENLGGGDYLIEGMKFNMTGGWELYVTVMAEAGSDTAVLEVTLE